MVDADPAALPALLAGFDSFVADLAAGRWPPHRLFGVWWGVWTGLTVVLFGWIVSMTGSALAATWKPLWHLYPYTLLLAFTDRFLQFALYHGPLLSPSAYAVDALVLLAFGLLSYRTTQVRKMITQYPWLYERAGLLGWRDKQPAG